MLEFPSLPAEDLKRTSFAKVGAKTIKSTIRLSTVISDQTLNLGKSRFPVHGLYAYGVTLKSNWTL